MSNSVPQPPTQRDAKADILDILGRVANNSSNLPRDHAKGLKDAIEAGAVQVSGTYTSPKKS